MRCETRSAKTEVARGRSVDRLDVDRGWGPSGISRSRMLGRWQVGSQIVRQQVFQWVHLDFIQHKISRERLEAMKDVGPCIGMVGVVSHKFGFEVRCFRCGN